MNTTFELITMVDQDKTSYDMSGERCVITATSADKAALLFMSQIFKSSRKIRVIRKLTIRNVKNSKTFTRTVIRYRDDTIPINGTRFRYVHKVILK